MDRKDQKDAMPASNEEIEKPVVLEDDDLDVVTGGLMSGVGVAASGDAVCITHA